MNPVSIAIGMAAILYGVYTFYLRRKDPAKFWKLEPMKKLWGEKLGLAIHIVGYSIVPIVFGIIMVLSGVGGGSFFGP